MAEKINIQIGLDGGEEVKRQLADIGRTGEAAFETIEKAADQVDFEKTVTSSEQAAEALAEASKAANETAQAADKGAQAADHLAESHRALSLETVKTSAEIVKLGAEITKIGVEIGLAVQRHRGWIATLVHMGQSANGAVRALALLAPELTAVATAVGVAAAAVGAAVIALNKLHETAQATAAPFEKLTHDLQGLATTSKQSFASLQQGEALFAQLGISAETFRSTIGKIAETLGDLDVSKELQKSREELEKIAGVKIVGLPQFIAPDKAEAFANALSKVLEQVKAIEAGQKGLAFDPLVKAETIIKAVAISMKEAADQGKNAVAVLVQFIANADKLTALKVGAAFGLKDEDVDRIQRAGGNLRNIEDIIRRIQGQGPLISPAAAATFDKLRTSIQDVEREQTRLNQAMKSSLPAQFAAQFSTSMNNAKASLLGLAASTIEFFNSTGPAAVNGLVAGVAALTGNFNPLISVLGQLGFSWAAFGQAAATSFNQVISVAGSAVSAIGNFISSITGISWDAISSAGVAAWNAIVDAIQSAGTAVADFVSRIGSITWDAISSAGVAAWNAIVDAIQGAGTAVADFVSRIGSVTWDAISNAGVAAWNAITSAIQGAINALLRFIGLKGSNGDSGGGAVPGKARGGLIGGRGSGTSDSNLAWLSRGEYVVPARAVRRPGVLAFLEALRRRGNLPGFQEGGVVGDFVLDPGSQGGALGQSITEILQQINNLAQIQNSLVAAVRSLIQQVASLTTSVDSLAEEISALSRNMSNLAQKQSSDASTLSEKFDEWGKQLNSKFDEWGRRITGERQTFKIERDEVSRRERDRELFGMARGGLMHGRGTGTSDGNLAWVSRGEHIMPARVVRKPGVLAFLEALRRGGNLPGFQEGGPVNMEGGAPVQLWDFRRLLEAELAELEIEIANFENGMTDAVGNIVKTQAEIIRFKKWVAQRKASIGRFQSDLKMLGIAGGGLIGGRGTGTSDSNLAWLSRGEHVMPARAVRQPGVLAFLEALRRSGGNLRHVLDGLGAFALGGLVPRPAFAAGGAVGSMSHVTINFPGLSPITGLRASDSVVEQLQRAAALAQVRSGGRKPSRYS